MKPLVVSSGEPAGIGPDICLMLANSPHPLVILGDLGILTARAKQLGLTIVLEPYSWDRPLDIRPNHLWVYPVVCPEPVLAGQLTVGAASYVLALLKIGVDLCLSQAAAAFVTAPVHKAIINQAGIPFCGHTEFFAEYTQSQTVMMLVCQQMKISLVTTHQPLNQVAKMITKEALRSHIQMVHQTLVQSWGIAQPKIHVAGLNPHAGEGGYLGQEEIQVITPVIHDFQSQGMDIHGPFSADTMFSEASACDVFVTMYHDQGLPVLKYASFGEAVNVTCGLPLIRTSVDHGTALALAGTGLARSGSLCAAVDLAVQMARHRMEAGR